MHSIFAHDDLLGSYKLTGYKDLTRHGKEVMDAVHRLPVWDAYLHGDGDGSVSIRYERKQGGRREYPVDIEFHDSWSALPSCVFLIDHRWTVEQTAKMMDWDRRWVEDTDLHWDQVDLTTSLERLLLRDLEPKVKLYGYLTGTFKYFMNFSLAPIWKADMIILRLHICEHSAGSFDAGIWECSEANSLEECVTALKEHFRRDVDRFYFEDYIVIPTRILPKNFLEKERRIMNAIFPFRKAA